jgi:prolipoprotein diacylglyceryltransferase
MSPFDVPPPVSVQIIEALVEALILFLLVWWTERAEKKQRNRAKGNDDANI